MKWMVSSVCSLGVSVNGSGFEGTRVSVVSMTAFFCN